MGQLAIVNAPPSFTAIWSVIKRWLSKETAEKVDVLGKDYKDVLLNLIDAESLPSTLGGKCECADHGGCHLSGTGPWMDGRVGWGPKSQATQEMEKPDAPSMVDTQVSLGDEGKYDRDVHDSLNGISDVISSKLPNGTMNGVYVVDGQDVPPIVQV